MTKKMMTCHSKAKSKAKSGWRAYFGVHKISKDRADFAIEAIKKHGKEMKKEDGSPIAFQDRIFFRSRMEANYARYLEQLLVREDSPVVGWLYEPCRFSFQFEVSSDGEIKQRYRANFDYIPDFLVIFEDGHHLFLEVKGVMDNKSRVKLNRMKKHFPEIHVELVEKKQYREAAKLARVRGFEWECV